VGRSLTNARMEHWDRGWCRVWEPLPYRTPDAELSRELASRLAAYVTALEPILRRELPTDVEWQEPQARPARARGAVRSRAPRSARG
jgi:hypothetical protein